MGNIDRLLGKLEQFMKFAECEFQKNSEDHKDIRRALDDLSAFKWRVLGAATAASSILSVAITLLLKFIR